MSIYKLLLETIYNIIITMKIMLKILRLTMCAVLAAFVLLPAACNTGGEQRHFTAFNNVDITVQARGKTLTGSAADKIRALITELNAEFSATVNTSTVSKINSASAGDSVNISERFKFVADVCGKMYEFTEGKFDPSVYPLSILWQFSPNFPVANFAVPTDEEITATKELIGYDKFTFGGTWATKTLDGAKIDFGGALKGYCSDKIAEIMAADGIKGGYVNVGGSSINILSVDSLSIVHPRNRTENILTVKLSEDNLAVSTSGDYEKNYTTDGKTYSHLIDASSGRPAETGVASATVIGRNGLKLDALTTALCLFSHDFKTPENGELYKFIQKILASEDFTGAQVFAVCVNGEEKQILTNKKQGDDFTLNDSGYKIITVRV